MFGIGFVEIVVILVVALIVVGPDKLPGLARSVGKIFVDFKRTMRDVRETVQSVESAGELKPKRRSLSEVELPSDKDGASSEAAKGAPSGEVDGEGAKK